MNRTEHLKQHEDRAGKRERAGESIAALHDADEHAHRDGERRRQDTEELPFLALSQSLEHDRIPPQNRRAHRVR